jgi:environmental stress-induced protein Ves
MTAAQVVQLQDARPQPWRNGGGLTRELLAWPPGAPAWALRVSVAEVEAAGPFSAFPGVQRCFAVLEGGGLRLDWPGRSVVLAAGGPPLAFDGADAPQATPLHGPSIDLNLMVRHDAGRAWMGLAPPPANGPCRWRGVFDRRALRWSDRPDTDPWPGAPTPAWHLALFSA